MKNKLILLLAAVLMGSPLFFIGKSDKYIRGRVVLLRGEAGSCSGEQIRARSGKDYILSAAHCLDLAKNGSITVITEDGKELKRAIIAEDVNSDLLLIEGLPNLKGLDISKNVKKEQKVRTFTHGRGMPTYKTEGVAVTEKLIEIPLRLLSDEKELKECTKMPKYSVAQSFFGPLCVLKKTETVITAMVVPGSSGGPVVDSSGDLVGVVSATDGNFGFLVTPGDINLFVDNY